MHGLLNVKFISHGLSNKVTVSRPLP